MSSKKCSRPTSRTISDICNLVNLLILQISHLRPIAIKNSLTAKVELSYVDDSVEPVADDVELRFLGVVFFFVWSLAAEAVALAAKEATAAAPRLKINSMT